MNDLVKQMDNNNPQRSKLRGRQTKTKQKKKNICWNCEQSDINSCKIESLKQMSIKELTVRSSLRRRRSALDCSAISETEDGKKEEELYYIQSVSGSQSLY